AVQAVEQHGCDDGGGRTRGIARRGETERSETAGQGAQGDRGWKCSTHLLGNRDPGQGSTPSRAAELSRLPRLFEPAARAIEGSRVVLVRKYPENVSRSEARLIANRLEQRGGVDGGEIGGAVGHGLKARWRKR